MDDDRNFRAINQSIPMGSRPPSRSTPRETHTQGECKRFLCVGSVRSDLADPTRGRRAPTQTFERRTFIEPSAADALVFWPCASFGVPVGLHEVHAAYAKSTSRITTKFRSVSCELVGARRLIPALPENAAENDS